MMQEKRLENPAMMYTMREKDFFQMHVDCQMNLTQNILKWLYFEVLTVLLYKSQT